MKSNVAKLVTTLFIIGLAIVALLMGIISAYSMYIGFTSGMFECLILGWLCMALSGAGLAIIYVILCKCF